MESLYFCFAKPWNCVVRIVKDISNLKYYRHTVSEIYDTIFDLLVEKIGIKRIINYMEKRVSGIDRMLMEYSSTFIEYTVLIISILISFPSFFSFLENFSTNIFITSLISLILCIAMMFIIYFLIRRMVSRTMSIV
mgnify:CR=1 FL=1